MFCIKIEVNNSILQESKKCFFITIYKLLNFIIKSKRSIKLVCNLDGFDKNISISNGKHQMEW